MSLCILLLLVLVLLFGRPRFVKELPMNGGCMTHDRTNLINAFFIVIIVLRHINQRIVPFQGIDLWYGGYFDGPAGQAIVSTFFFFSGYGIFQSIRRKRETYVRELMSKRFLRLYVNTGICCAVSCLVYLITHLTPEESFLYFCKTMVGAGGYWFILMTLAIYVLTWVSFRVCGVNRPLTAIVLSFILIYILCVGLIPVKPMWWLDTELCFPCGMLMGLYLPQVENCVRKVKLPIMFVGCIVAILGWMMMKWYMLGFYLMKKMHFFDYLSEGWISRLSQAYHIFFYPLCTVVWVLGILWFFAGIKWEKIPAFMVWLGGPAVFYIFVLHFIPIRIIQAGGLAGPYPILSADLSAKIVSEPMGWGASQPEFAIIGMILSTLLLAYVAHLIIPKIDRLIFGDRS